MNPETILTTAGFDEAQRDHLDGRRKIWPARAWYPSSLGHACDRFLVWRFIRSDEQDLHDHVLQSIFDQGNELQPIIQRRLEALGFTVQGEGDRPKQYKVGGAVISGRPDGKLIAYKGQKYRPAPVAEFKSMSSFQFEKTETLDDLRKSDSPYTRNYFAQGQLYAYLEDVPTGVYVLMNKVTGLLRLIPFDLDYGFVENLLQRVERLQPLVEQGIDPEPIPFSQSICGGCSFQKRCYPPRDFGAGAAILDDVGLIEELEAVDRLKLGHADYERRWKLLKARLKREGVTSAIAGPFQIEASERPVGEVRIPPRVDTIFDIRRIG